MGQKSSPVGLRLGIVRDHNALWFAEKERYRSNLAADFRLRKELKRRLANASVNRIEIKRMTENSAVVQIHTARPGVVLGRKGEDVEKITRFAQKVLSCNVHVNIIELSKPELSASLVAESIAQQLQRRVMFRRAMKRALQTTMRAGAQGAKIMVSGRLGGAEIARSEMYREGRVPLHTFRADVDFAIAEARTTYGVLGVKVWIFRGEILRGRKRVQDQKG